MKKIILVITLLSIIKHTHAQAPAWTQALNTIGGQPNFGTISNHPINFYTNNTMRMVLTTGGVLKINGLAGTTTRFLQSDEGGNLVAWTGSIGNKDKILFGDNSWRTAPFLTNGTNIYSESGNKVGIGVATPETELDINGGAQVKNGLRVGEGLYIGPADNYGLIRYTPGVNGKPSVFSFGGGGLTHPNNPNPNNSYNQFLGGHGAGDYSPDPQPNQFCVKGDTTSPSSINLFNDVLIIKKHAPLAVNGLLGNLRIGHNGNNAFLETQGTNGGNPNAGDLLINSQCNRNVYLFSNGTTFAPTTDHVMSVAGRVNITQNVQIGGGTLATNFEENTTMLYVNSPGASPTGIKVRHAGSGDALRIIELNAAKYAFAINKGTGSSDGTERFTVLGDGKTDIITDNTKAFSIKNLANSYESFSVLSDGKTNIITNNAQAIGVKKNGDSYECFSLAADGYTQIKTTATKALSIYNAGSSINETFSINKDGYTEIKVYDPAGMPTPYSAGYRALTIRDMSSSPNKDIFVVNSNGKVFAREVEISLVTNFPDYVFSKEYQLRSISEVEKYIDANKHLPGFENAEYYEKNGINVNQMLLKQQEKIEELTLYIIELEKRMQTVEKNK